MQSGLLSDVSGRVKNVIGQPGAIVRPIVTGIIVLIAWQVLAIFFPAAFPHPATAFEYLLDLLVNESGMVLSELLTSFTRILIAFLTALTIGSLIGILMGINVHTEEYAYPLVLVGMMIPGVSWGMITLTMFGLTETAIIIAIFLASMPYITVTVWEGVKTIDLSLVEMGAVFNVSKRDRVKHIILPQVYPHILSAARYGLGISWKVTAVIELLGASGGIGYQLSRAFSFYNLPAVVAWTVILVTVMMVIEYGIIRTIERYLLSWQHSDDIGVQRVMA